MSVNYNNHSEEENFLFGKNKELPFIVPNGYFDSLTAIIINKIEALEELAEFETLSGIDKKTAFSVPENYFNSVKNSIEAENELAVFSVLNSISKPEFKSLSNAYTNELKASISKKAEIVDELKEYQTLYAIDKKNNFVVSSEYFDSVADDVKERLYATSNKVSIFERILISILKPKIAIAYSIVILLIAGGVWYFNRDSYTMVKGAPVDCKTLACLEKNEILNEKNIPNFDDENLLDMVDVEQLDKQISDKDSVTVNNTIHK